jgi:3-hydroxybutyryl-CoA dehydrogenase
MSQEIETVAVLGAGTMGLGIAHVSALAGYETHLFDVQEAALEKAKGRIHTNLDKGVAKGKVEPAAAEAAKGNLHLHTDLAGAVKNAGLVIEAVPENVKLKIDTFAQVAAACPAEAIFASNTSGLSITEMAGASDRPERFAGMHFFNPVHIMKLVEIIRGLQTSDETIEVIRKVSERMGKETVLVNESPGFVTSRINALIGNEACRMLQEGVASPEDIDKALKLGLNHPMGPFEMVDLVGLDIRLSILEYLHKTLGETYRPAQPIVQRVRAGHLGRKTGRGFYVYDESGRRVTKDSPQGDR